MYNLNKKTHYTLGMISVDSSEQYDATRAFLKELDVVNNVWVGLKRSGSEGEFTWT